MREIFLCSISNTNSGECSQDCKFCTQSAHYNSGIESFRFKDAQEVLQEARAAQKAGTLGFCLVTSGKSLDDKRVAYVSQTAALLKKELPSLYLIACNGIADKESLRELKKAGIAIYNHNLETSREHYRNICTSMQWEERFQTCLNVKEAGLELCSGGLFGIGESEADIDSYFTTLRELQPKTSPVNFYCPNDALPLEQRTVTKTYAEQIAAKAKASIPETILMAAGGRNLVFENIGEVINSGFGAVIIGDYLTVKGERMQKDLEDLKKLGVEPATSC